MPSKNYQCPLCKSSIHKLKFDRVTGIWKSQQEENKKLKAEHQKMRDEIVKEKKKLVEERRKLQNEKKKVVDV